jgi:hypothetical protein
VKFRITSHSGFRGSTRPANALDLLWQRLGASRDQVSFAKVGAEIRATLREDAAVSLDQDVRVRMGRRAVLDAVIEVCERAPELNSDWFAVSARG